MRRSASTALAACIAPLALLSGCNPVALGLAVTSDATMLTAANWNAGVGYRSVQSNVPSERGVHVSLFPYNWNAARDPKYFSVAVDFASDPNSRADIQADFRGFTLHLRDGSVVRPIGYASTYPGTVSQGCRNGSGDNSLPTFKPLTLYDIHPLPATPVRIRSNPWSRLSECYDVVFPVATLAPDKGFSINVAGVSINGLPMREERVLFVRGEGR